MRIRILGCSGGIGAGSRTSAMLIDDDVLIDAGTGIVGQDITGKARILVGGVAIRDSDWRVVAAPNVDRCSSTDRRHAVGDVIGEGSGSHGVDDGIELEILKIGEIQGLTK